MKENNDEIIPKQLIEILIAKYKGGLSIAELEMEYNIPFATLSQILTGIKSTAFDFVSESLGKIMNAESLLIKGSFPDYKLNKDVDGKKYKSLLFYYSTSDLNAGHVHVSNRLLS